MNLTDIGTSENCAHYDANAAYGPVNARLVNNSLVLQISTACNEATYLVGSLDLDTPITMTEMFKDINSHG